MSRLLNICVYNLENFYICPENFINDLQTPLKSDKKLQDLALVFLEIDADIFCLSEVGGTESLAYFNKNYLNDEYLIFLEKGNSDRGIEVAFLVKKSLPYKLKFVSNKNQSINVTLSKENTFKTKHSRDLIELHLLDPRDLSKTECIIFNTHLKSQRENFSEDFRGQKRRNAEFLFMIEKFKSYRKTCDCPIFMTGDLNANASRFQTDPEFIRGLVENDLIDVLDIVDLPRENRATYYIFQGNRKIPVQLDYALLDRASSKCVTDAAVYRYKNELQTIKFLPRSKLDITENPSDHYPLVFIVNIPE